MTKRLPVVVGRAHCQKQLNLVLNYNKSTEFTLRKLSLVRFSDNNDVMGNNRLSIEHNLPGQTRDATECYWRRFLHMFIQMKLIAFLLVHLWTKVYFSDIRRSMKAMGRVQSWRGALLIFLTFIEVWTQWVACKGHYFRNNFQQLNST